MKILASLGCILLLFSCKPYTSTAMKTGEITYSQFRAKQLDFSSSFGNIKYVDQGEGAVILLLHGVPTSGWLYRNMIDELSRFNRVIVPDMLGFGHSDSPEGYEIYNEENHATRLLELMNHLGVPSWTHVTHDAGGLWTWELMRKDPNRIEKLVVLNTIIYEAGFDPPIRMKKGFIARTAMWSYRNGITTNMMLRGLFKTGLKENNLNKTDLEGYKTPLLEGKTKAMYYFFTQTCQDLPLYEEVLQQSNIPVAVIWGQHDEFLLWEPQKNAVIKDMKISEENIHIIDAKHFIQEEQPAALVQFIQEFCRK